MNFGGSKKLEKWEESVTLIKEEVTTLKKEINTLQTDMSIYADNMADIVCRMEELQKVILGFEKRLIEKTEQTVNKLNVVDRKVNGIREIKDGMIRAKDQNILPYLVLNICDHCNLRCRGCDHFASVAKKRNVSVNAIKNDLHRMKEIMGNGIMKIGVMGGEPLLHPDLKEILITARKEFPYSVVNLNTNGLLLERMDEEFWNICKENDITIAVTVYPVDLDYDRQEEYVKGKGVTYIYYDKNSKTQGKTLKRLPFDLQGTQDVRDSFFHCRHANNCTMLMEGKIYPCTIAPNSHIFNEAFNQELKLQEEDWIDIYKVRNKKEIFDFLKKPIPFCRYCDVHRRSDGHKWEMTRNCIEDWL